MKKLAIVTTHPIQYNAPLFALLSSRKKISIKVFYTWSQTVDGKLYDPGFGIDRSWDIPLLKGYDYCFVKNVSTEPGTHHFLGIQNPSLIDEIKGYNPNAILVFGWSFYSHLKVMRYFKGRKKILFRGDSTLIDEPAGFSLKKILRRTALCFVYRHVDVALYCGRNNKNYFLKNGIKQKSLIFAPHCIDNQRFKTDASLLEHEAALWRERIGIFHNEIVFLFAGKLEKKKNVQLLVEAFLQLPIKNKKLIIVGNGPLENQLRELTKNTRSVLFLPFQNQSKMPVIYRMGDVFVLPSKGPGETWGLALNEAMACGKAVIASDKCGGAVDLIKEGLNGYIFKSGSLKSLYDRMRNISFANKIAFGEQSKEIIETFSYESVCEVIESTI